MGPIAVRGKGGGKEVGYTFYKNPVRTGDGLFLQKQLETQLAGLALFLQIKSKPSIATERSGEHDELSAIAT